MIMNELTNKKYDCILKLCDWFLDWLIYDCKEKSEAELKMREVAMGF